MEQVTRARLRSRVSVSNKPDDSAHVLQLAWEALKRDFDASCAHSALTAGRQITYEFNQFFRRLRQYESESDWFSAILDCAGRFASQVAVFAVNGTQMELRVQQNLKLAPGFATSLAAAGAFASAVESKDPVVALRSLGEVGELLATPETAERAHLFPVTNGSRVVAIIFAAGEEYLDVNALELIACLGSATLERRANEGLHTQIIPAPDRAGKAVEAKTMVPERTLPSWADLGEEHRSQHIKAQRFSRVAVAEMQLFRPDACRAGLEQNNLYLYLKKEIDKARDTYRKRFMDVRAMVDYLHLELVQTAAAGDELKLGAEYPGQLV